MKTKIAVLALLTITALTSGCDGRRGHGRIVIVPVHGHLGGHPGLHNHWWNFRR